MRNIFLFQVITCLQALPIRQIACGGNHTIVVSVSGAVYAWGRNNRGQLGVGDSQVQDFIYAKNHRLQLTFLCGGAIQSIWVGLVGGAQSQLIKLGQDKMISLQFFQFNCFNINSNRRFLATHQITSNEIIAGNGRIPIKCMEIIWLQQFVKKYSFFRFLF